MITVRNASLAVEHLEQFKNIIGSQYVFVDEEVLHNYASDETEDLHFLPDVVLKPGRAKKLAQQKGIAYKKGDSDGLAGIF